MWRHRHLSFSLSLSLSPPSTSRSPFSDFLLTSLGYVQNEQTHLNINMIRSIGIGLADAIDGPFKLDIRGVTTIAMRKEITDLDV